MAIAKIRGDIAHYSWGGEGAISELFGWPASQKHEAEWWLGTHPLRPSMMAAENSTLGSWLERHGCGAQLPYLFKVLAPAAPLSLQVHPSEEQARAGFDAEERAGVALTSPLRNYKDPFAKPELVVALDRPFHALAGIRDIRDTLAVLAAISGGDSLPAVEQWRARLSAQKPSEVIAWLLSGEGGVADLSRELAGLAGRDDTLDRLQVHHPGDPGIAVAMMLNPVTLQPGEALFLEAGQLHAYLEGLAVEVMAPSDNVLRGGLTEKNIDVAELLAVASGEATPPPRLPGRVDDSGVVHFEPPGQGFAVHCLAGEGLRVQAALETPAVLVAISGEWSVQGHTDQVRVQRGEAAVVSGGESPLIFSGSGELWWVTPVV